MRRKKANASIFLKKSLPNNLKIYKKIFWLLKKKNRQNL